MKLTKFIRRTILASAMGVCVLGNIPYAHAATFPLGSDSKASLVLTSTAPAWTVHLSSGETFTGGFTVIDGKTEKPLVLQPTGPEKEESGKVLQTYSAGSGIRVILSVNRTSAGYAGIEVSVANESSEQLLLEPILHSRWESTSKWFDGFAEQKGPGKRNEISGTLPFAAIYSAKAGIAMGLDARDLVSHFKSESGPIEAQGNLAFSSRMVIDPGKTELRRFLLYTFNPDFGFLNAMAEYYRFFPEQFAMHPKVNPETAGPLIGGVVWRTQNTRYLSKSRGINDKITDIVRWMGGGWEWSYAGFGYRPGDWLCTEELTGDWILPTKEGPVPFRKHFKMSAAEYLRQHLDAFDRNSTFGIASMCYIVPNYCEEELALKNFPDSIYYDSQKRPRSAGPPWVVEFDRSLQMYPYGNSFGDYTLKAIKTIVERSNIQGFAFDCIDRARYFYRGPGMDLSPGRAYDEEGVYVNSEIAHAKFGQAVHELKRGEETMALVGNFRGDTGSYLAAFAMDAALIEHAPWDERPRALNVRYLMGSKSSTFLRGFGRLPEVGKRKDEALVEMTSTLLDFSILQCLHIGMYPNFRYVMGSPKMIYYMGIFNDLFRNYGWTPVPAARGEKGLWITRYGSGAGGVVFAGNPTAKAVEDQLTATASYFDAASVAFVDYEGRKPLSNEIKGDSTTVPVPLARGGAALLQAALQWATPFVGSVEGRRETQPGVKTHDAFVIHAKGGAAHDLFVEVPPGFSLQTVKLGDAKLKVTRQKNRATFTANLAEGSNRLEINWLPNIQLETPTVLAEINFVDKAKDPVFFIEVEKKTPSSLRAAARIVNFFSVYRHGFADAAKVVEIPIIASGEKPPLKAGPRILIKTPAEDDAFGPIQGRINGEVDTLTISGNNRAAIDGAVDLLLSQLSERYPDYGYFQVSEGDIPADNRAFQPTLFQKNTNLNFLPWKQ